MTDIIPPTDTFCYDSLVFICLTPLAISSHFFICRLFLGHLMPCILNSFPFVIIGPFFFSELKVRPCHPAVPHRPRSQPVVCACLRAARAHPREGTGVRRCRHSLREGVGNELRVLYHRGLPLGLQLPQGKEVQYSMFFFYSESPCCA